MRGMYMGPPYSRKLGIGMVKETWEVLLVRSAERKWKN
jgi:hypothetical protein